MRHFQLGKGNVVQLLAEWRKRLREALEKNEDVEALLQQAEKELAGAGFPLAGALLRQELIRLRLLRPIQPPSATPPAFKPIEAIPPWQPPTPGPGRPPELSIPEPPAPPRRVPEEI